ncbi:MAG: PCP reductase family protein, partial [Candidatus Binatia bacterium]
SELEWTADAVARILRVPAGFMRNRTQQRIEDLAREHGRISVDLALVEEGIEHGRKLMEEMIQGYKQNPAPAREAVMPEPPAERRENELPLNEVGIMAVMEVRRLGDTGK